MEKIVALLLAMLMLVSLTACGAGKELPDTPTIITQMPGTDVAESTVTPSADPSSNNLSDESSTEPTEEPSVEPSDEPSTAPSATPDAETSIVPSVAPSVAPSAVPSAVPSASPSALPSVAPSTAPTEESIATSPSDSITPVPSSVPSSPMPSAEPSPETAAELTAKAFWEGESEKYADTTPAMIQLSYEELELYYGLDMANVDDFYCAIPLMSTNIQEVFIAHVIGDMDTVRATCEARQQLLAGDFLYRSNADLVESYRIDTCGDWIIFVIHANAEEIIADFQVAFAE